MNTNPIPRYFVYGEPMRLLAPGFIHVELISDRKSLHRGHVAMHSHPNMSQLTCWTRGGGRYSIEDETWSFSAPAMAWLPSGVVHGFEVTGKSEAIVLSVADDALPMARPREAGFSVLRAKHADWQDVLRLMSMLQRQHAAGSYSILEPLTATTLAIATRLISSNQTGTGQTLALQLKVLVDETFRKPLKVADYALSLNSTYHLVDKASRQVFGFPVKQLVLERRMLEAKRLLKFTIRSAEDIAFELGFEDPAYFNRAFKKHVGLAPVTWRKQQN
jgi:AraC family transcriptional regulator, transcriptional activator of pobA